VTAPDAQAYLRRKGLRPIVIERTCALVDGRAVYPDGDLVLTSRGAMVSRGGLLEVRR